MGKDHEIEWKDVPKKLLEIAISYYDSIKVRLKTRNRQKLALYGLSCVCAFLFIKTIFSSLFGSSVTVETFCNVYSYNTPLERQFECLPLIVQPSPTVCIANDDRFVSANIKNGGVWERDKVFSIYRVLQRYPKYAFIDLGANIGQFSLVAAKLGHRVIAVEPYAKNIEPFHQSIKVGNFDKNITIVQNAISNTRRKSSLILNRQDNPGGTQLEVENDQAVRGEVEASVIVLDDLLEVINFKSAILKTDIEGYEHRAIVNGTNFLDRLDIPYIFMEWLFMRELCAGARRPDKHYDTLNLGPVMKAMTVEDEQLMFKMMRILLRRKYKPYSMEGKILDPRLCDKWPEDVIWMQEDAE